MSTKNKRCNTKVTSLISLYVFICSIIFSHLVTETQLSTKAVMQGNKNPYYLLSPEKKCQIL